jgi:hypothetical protein
MTADLDPDMLAINHEELLARSSRCGEPYTLDRQLVEESR